MRALRFNDNFYKFLDTTKMRRNKMDKYVCSVCGYIYNPAEGDPDGSIPPGTPFEDLPSDWTCPVCGASKSQFKKKEN